MQKAIRVLTNAFYGAVGTILLAAGGSALLFNTGLLPDALKGILVDFSRGDLNTLHVMQEFGSVLVFTGLITLWFLLHYEQSQAFHWSMTTFWALFALVHWFDVRGPFASIAGPLVNTVPFLLFVAIGLLRTAAEGKPPDRGGRHPADQDKAVSFEFSSGEKS
jgi:hypothetical protein